MADTPPNPSELETEKRRWEAARYRRVRTNIVQVVAMLVAALSAFILTSSEAFARLTDYSWPFISFGGTLFSVTALAGAAVVATRLFLDYGNIVHIGQTRNVRFDIEHIRPQSAVDLPPKDDRPLAEILTSELRFRLQAEVEAQGRKASTNLAVGGVLALIGAGFLAWLAFEASRASLVPGATPPTPMLYWGALLSKVALSTTANIFAFFFLATYRRNLTEVKYFQNELTNVESRAIATAIALDRDGAEIEKVIGSLLNVERNFILKRGETTADLTIKSLDQTEIQTLVALIAQNLDANRLASRNENR